MTQENLHSFVDEPCELESGNFIISTHSVEAEPGDVGREYCYIEQTHIGGKYKLVRFLFSYEQATWDYYVWEATLIKTETNDE